MVFASARPDLLRPLMLLFMRWSASVYVCLYEAGWLANNPYMGDVILKFNYIYLLSGIMVFGQQKISYNFDGINWIIGNNYLVKVCITRYSIRLNSAITRHLMSVQIGSYKKIGIAKMLACIVVFCGGKVTQNRFSFSVSSLLSTRY